MTNLAGAKTSRSATVGVRLDPKLLCLADIAARIQGRTLSSFIEWSIKRVLTNGVIEDEPVGPDKVPTALQPPRPMANEGFWDVDEAIRFWKLALGAPDLLREPERHLWTAYTNGGGSENKPELFRKAFPKLKAQFLGK